MLKKLLSISNVGRFSSYSAAGSVEFAKLTLIFGENGRGKSTITSILRSLQLNDGNHISERSTLPATAGTPEVQVRHQTGSYSFKGGAWSTAMPDIEIFDAQFINDNVFSGLTVDHEHKRNLYRIIVGEQGVLLSRKVEELDIAIRQANSDLTIKKAEIKPLIADALDIDKFVELPQFDKVDELILKKNEEISALMSAADIASKASFAEVAFPSAPGTAILGKTLQDLSKEADDAVKAHTLKLDKRGEQWLEQGVTYLKNETCPFCTQSTAGINLVASYQAYFSKAYKELKEDIRQHSKGNDDRFGALALLAIQNNITGNTTLSEFWKRFFEVKLSDLPTPDTVQALKGLHTHLKERLDVKSGSPLDSVPTTPELDAALKLYADFLTKAVAYNASCKAMNEFVKVVKAKASGGNIVAATADLSKLKNAKKRHDPAVDTLCKEYLLLKLRKVGHEAEKEKAKTALDTYSSTIFTLYEGTLNDQLKLFGAEFLLANTSSNYAGGKPNSSYNITINTVPVDVDSTFGKPCFKSALSGGDKSCLALAFFLARLEHDPRIGDKVVVLDDPMCSLDRFRSDRTVKAIVDLVDKAKQVIVLSHDPHFLRRIWDDFSPPGNRKALYVHRIGTKESTLAEWDIVNDTRSEYLQDYFALADYLAKGVPTDMRDLARKIRVILEENLRMRFPDVFGSGQWLGDFLQAIRNSNAGDVVFPMKKNLNELDALNDFSKKFHHAENPGASKEPITDAELQNYAARTLTFLRGTP